MTHRDDIKKETKFHPHSLIYMRGIKSENLLAIVNFLDCGEANVYQDNLDSFLVTAEELNLNGLIGGQTEDVDMKTESFPDQIPRQTNPKPFYDSRISNSHPGQRQSNSKEQPPIVKMNSERRIAIPNFAGT